MNIQLIKNESEMPRSLVPNAIVMNGLDYELPLGYIKEFSGIRVGTTLKELKTFAEHCDCVGALLSYDGERYVIWNGDSSGADYWNPREYNENGLVEPSTKYGTVIAVCAGKGLWPVRNWYGNKSEQISLTIDGNSNSMCKGYMCWAPNGADLYNTYVSFLARSCDGYENTKHLFLHFGTEIASWNHTKINAGDTFASWNDYYAALTPLWEQLTKTHIDGLDDWIISSAGELVKEGNLFIPSDNELKVIWRNCFNNNSEDASGDTPDLDEDSYGCYYTQNIGRLLGLSDDSYWSSSQYPDDYNSAYIVNFSNGSVENTDKDSSCLSVACIHF